MGATTTTQKPSLAQLQTDPLRNFKFQVQIHLANSTLDSSKRTNQLGFMSVSGLSITTDVVVYRQGGMNTTTQKMPGQAQPLDSKVLTPEGYKRMGDMAVGDAVMDPRGQTSTVLGVYPQGVLPVYEVVTVDGARAMACLRHRWEVSDGETSRVINTVEMQHLLKNGASLFLPSLHPVVFEAAGVDTAETAHGRKVDSVTYVGDEEVQCIAVSADSHLYVTDGLLPTHNSDFAPITLSRGLICGDSDIYAWLTKLFKVMQGTGGNDGAYNFRATMDIYLLDHPVTTQSVTYKAGWRVYNCWPTSIAFGDLDSGANGVELQQITLAHEGWDFKIANKFGPGSGVSLP
ncbi:phage tail protein [Streptomyces sp. NPDC005499]|uniref:phage tail protein n=1 Tax=Streptomyces sp. NPDC005499 TaxID=3154883 RepID=UPI0033A354B9